MRYATPEPSSVIHTAARDELGRGGTTLWRHADNGFTVIVYQTHDEPEGSLGSRDDYDMIELRVVSARCSARDFWNRDVRRVTHKKWSWFLACMDPAKDYDAMKVDMKGSGYRDTWYSFDDYEGLVDKAEAEGKKAVASLDRIRSSTVGSHEPWAKAYKLDKGGAKDKFWACAVFADDFNWVVKIDYGVLRNFGRIYPRYWETGHLFDSYQRAEAFAQSKAKAQVGKGFVEDSSTSTLRILKWSLAAAITDADSDGGAS